MYGTEDYQKLKLDFFDNLARLDLKKFADRCLGLGIVYEGIITKSKINQIKEKLGNTFGVCTENMVRAVICYNQQYYIE